MTSPVGGGESPYGLITVRLDDDSIIRLSAAIARRMMRAPNAEPATLAAEVPDFDTWSPGGTD